MEGRTTAALLASKQWHTSGGATEAWFMGALRRALRRVFFEVLRRGLATDDGRAILNESLAGRLVGPPKLGSLGEPWTVYRELGGASARGANARPDAVFITARFRSGSTLLWNLFRHVPGCTAYYEPLNERRWFEPAMRGGWTDPTHKGVEDYWREYEGLSELGKHHRVSWTYRNIYMGAEAWDPGMKRFIEILMERATGRPVLQFNRIDFRLPWVRHTFPGVKIVHLYRHPREQWCSVLRDISGCPKGATVGDFQQADWFYTLAWARDLKYQFPFLAEEAAGHPYELFYYLWRLSYAFGREYADHSVGFEELVSEPERVLADLLDGLGFEAYDLGLLKSLIVKPERQRWPEYADDAWFGERESHCEQVLEEFVGAAGRTALRVACDVEAGAGQ